MSRKRYQKDLAKAPRQCSIIGTNLSKASRHRPCPATLSFAVRRLTIWVVRSAHAFVQNTSQVRCVSALARTWETRGRARFRWGPAEAGGRSALVLVAGSHQRHLFDFLPLFASIALTSSNACSTRLSYQLCQIGDHSGGFPFPPPLSRLIERQRGQGSAIGKRWLASSSKLRR